LTGSICRDIQEADCSNQIRKENPMKIGSFLETNNIQLIEPTTERKGNETVLGIVPENLRPLWSCS
jgi:hypothetical protein